ncbi:type II toxin-antitoxin system RelB/DinJ family antitoxin [Granulicatella balaenopterae]|nr:type II toxin-antitoxin system RelB/DinJ family antitoxin [Granulicatella balaenopterae]
MAGSKTASISCRIEEGIKEQAEAILQQIGLPRSVAIDMFYRQIIMNNGIPFSLTIPKEPVAHDMLTKDELNQILMTGLVQAKANDSFTIDEVFDELENDL